MASPSDDFAQELIMRNSVERVIFEENFILKRKFKLLFSWMNFFRNMTFCPYLEDNLGTFQRSSLLFRNEGERFDVSRLARFRFLLPRLTATPRGFAGSTKI